LYTWLICYIYPKARIINTLIEQLKSGDREAFRQLVAQYQQKVFNTAISLVQDHGMAEDISQEVFVTVYKSILTFNERSSLGTWIYRITVNKSLDHLRARSRRRQGIIGQLFYRDSGEPVVDKPEFVHPGVQLERKEKSVQLFKAIETLPENQKTVFVLAHIEDLPQKEIAEIMNMSVKGVESLLQRAKGSLRKQLSHIYNEGKQNN
jgi:RNA polymerase sigma-70 factor (ECF subfamily)